MDTPIPERRKNWFTRQITRMGSVRSSSTAYSSGGIFNRTRHNSVYASPETGQPGFNQLPQNNGQIQPNLQHHQHQPKMSLYDRLIGRRSSRGQRQIIRQGKHKSRNYTRRFRRKEYILIAIHSVGASSSASIILSFSEFKINFIMFPGTLINLHASAYMYWQLNFTFVTQSLTLVL